MKRTIPILLACALGLALSNASRAATDIVIPTPEGVRLHEVAGDLILNGRHSRILRFDMAGSVDDALAFYRRRFGARHVENDIAGDRTIAARQEGYFITVRIHPVVGGHVLTTVISSRLGGDRNHSRVETDTEAILPAGSSILQTQESTEADRASVLLMAANNDGMRTNHETLIEGFRVRGFRVVTDSTGEVHGRPAVTLTLSSSTEDATANIVDTGRYRTVLLQRNRRSP